MRTALDKRSPTPLYHQLKSVILDAILSGGLKPDDRLPTETELAAAYHVSKITVREALRELADMGYVRREQGRGTFVAKPKLDHGPRQLTSFTGELNQRGMKATSRVMQQSVVKASGRVAMALELAEGEPVFVLKRLRMADSQPMSIETAHIPLAAAPGLDRIHFENTSVYELLQNRFGLQAAKARETYLAVAAGADDAELLGIPCGAPVFAVERVTFPPEGKPFEFVQSVMRGDRYSVVLELAAPQ